MIGALAVLDRFSFKAALRKGPYRIVDAAGTPIGWIGGSFLKLSLHAEIKDEQGEVLLAGVESDRYDDRGRTVEITDRDGGHVGSVTNDAGVYWIRERWHVRNGVDEPVVVIDERGSLRSALDQFRWYAGRRYAVHLPTLQPDGIVGLGERIGSVKRSWLGRRWIVEVSGDPQRVLDRRFVMAGVAVIAVSQL